MNNIEFYRVVVHGRRYLVAASSVESAVALTKKHKLSLWRKIFSYTITAETDVDPVPLTELGVKTKLNYCDIVEPGLA